MLRKKKIWTSTTPQLSKEFADEDNVKWSKAPQQLQNGPCGEIVCWTGKMFFKLSNYRNNEHKTSKSDLISNASFTYFVLWIDFSRDSLILWPFCSMYNSVHISISLVNLVVPLSQNMMAKWASCSDTCCQEGRRRLIVITFFILPSWQRNISGSTITKSLILSFQAVHTQTHTFL